MSPIVVQGFMSLPALKLRFGNFKITSVTDLGFYCWWFMDSVEERVPSKKKITISLILETADTAKQLANSTIHHLQLIVCS